MKFPFHRPALTHGFTLVELLVVITIIGVLVGLTMPVLGKVRAKGGMLKELAAGKQLMAGFHLYASDHNGQLLPGYKADPARDDHGNDIPFPENARYPWRIAPYLDYRAAGTLVVNEQQNLLEQKNYAYTVSVFPTFGMNSTFVGGDYGTGAELPATTTAIQKFGKFFVSRVGEAASAAQLIVFTSARYKVASTASQGYYQVLAPSLKAPRWSSAFSESDPSIAFGHVHPRWDGRAVCAMLDGHTELLDTTQLRDMRHWSNQAALADRADWVLTTQ